MSFKNPNTSQCSDDFHALKDTISEIDYGIDPNDDKKEKKKETKKFLFKKDSKDKGYSSLTGDVNQDSVFLVNTKSNKKVKADAKKSSLNVFKKSFKDEKRLKDIKESKEGKQKENLFGNYLENAVSSYQANDGVKVPYPIRICIDLIEQKGIDSENIYRHHANKSHLESICESINKDENNTWIDGLNADPNLACAIIKKFFKELKSPLIPEELLSLIDKCEGSDKDHKIEQLKKILQKLPEPNYETFAYLLTHFYRVLKKNDVNKIEVSFFVQKFQPIFRIKERVFKFMIIHADLLFSDFRIKRYRVKTNDETISRMSLIPESIEDLEQEIAKQELYLSKLHSRIANEENSNDKKVQEQLSEQLWALQRYVTSLKRKVKKLKMERKLIEAEQIKSINEENALKYPPHKSKDNKESQLDDQISKSPIENKTNDSIAIDLNELERKEINLICENLVIIESMLQVIEKILNERAIISNLQQNNLEAIQVPIAETAYLNIQNLYENEQMILNENKLFEERINLINKRINLEKEKIFELKLNIKIQTFQAITNESNFTKKPNDLATINKLEKEILTTKL